MNKKITRAFITGGIVFGLILSTTPVLAFTENRIKNLELRVSKAVERRENIKDNLEKMKEKREENVEKRCEKVNENIDKRIGTFNINKDNRIKHYQNIKTKFLAIADRLDKKGVNTTKLRTDAVTLDEKVKKLSSDNAALIAKLGESKQYQCGKSEGQFKTALEQAREVHKIVLADGKDINEFIRTVLWEDVKDMRSQIVKPTETE